MAQIWRCNWCGKKQPIEALDQAVQGEHEWCAFGWAFCFPVHTCCPDHDSKMRRYFAFCKRWMYPCTAGFLALFVVIAISAMANSIVMAGLAVAGCGLLLLFFPAIRNTVKLDPETKHRFSRRVGDLLLPNATPGDVLVCWRTGIRVARVLGALLFALGLLVAFGVLG